MVYVKVAMMVAQKAALMDDSMAASKAEAKVGW